MYQQFIHLGAYGVKPRAGEPLWSCVDGITAEGARIPGASRHIPYPREAPILHGASPLEAGRLAKERAVLARDAKGRRLRRDGIVLIAGVASYPTPRKLVADDFVEADFYSHWRNLTIDWLLEHFGEHLVSVVEHGDEEFMHLHFYLVPKLLTDFQLDLPAFHPGRATKFAAAEAGASKKDQDAAYRRGMEMFQDDFHCAVSRFFGHARFGARRMRVSRREREMQKRMDAEAERQRAALDAQRAKFDGERADAEAALARMGQQLIASANIIGAATNFEGEQTLRAAVSALRAQHDAERARREAADAEIAALRARLAAPEGDMPIPLRI